jgi:isopenicillin N synthase-like dioxygenase
LDDLPLFRIPFFFEPNFDAVIRPLAVVSRLKGEEPGKNVDAGALRRPVVYGDFLVSKVGNNFESAGKGRYD